jgi:hypothetical protein
MITEPSVLDGDEGVADIRGQRVERDDLTLVVSAPRDRPALDIDQRDIAAGIVDEQICRVGEVRDPGVKNRASGENAPDQANEKGDARHGPATGTFGFLVEVEQHWSPAVALFPGRPVCKGGVVAGHLYAFRARLNLKC